MKNSKLFRAVSFFIVYLLVFSFVPVNNLVKAATNSSNTISGYKKLYVIDAEQVEDNSAIITTTTNSSDSGNIRVVIENGNGSKNVDLNIESTYSQYMGKYNNNLYFYDFKNHMIYSVDVKSAKISGQINLASKLPEDSFNGSNAAIDNNGVIWIYDTYSQLIAKIINDDCKVLIGAKSIFSPIKNSSYFLSDVDGTYKIGGIDKNNNINIYDFPSSYDYYNVNFAIDNQGALWIYNNTTIIKLEANDKNQLVPVQKYSLDSDLGYYELSFDHNNNPWLNYTFDGLVFQLVNGKPVEKYNYDVNNVGDFSNLSIYDENNFILSTYKEGYLRYSTSGAGPVNTADQLYRTAYDLTMQAISSKTQKAINQARVAIEALRGTGAEWAIGEFSKNVDQIQQPFLVNICNAISAAEANPTQVNINAANALIEDVKTATDPAIAAWAVEMQKQLQK